MIVKEECTMDRDKEVERAINQTNQTTMPSSPPSERFTLDNIDDAFRYQPWDECQRDHGEQVRDALVAAAKVILRTVPDTPLRTRALNCLIHSRMLANCAISFRGRF